MEGRKERKEGRNLTEYGGKKTVRSARNANFQTLNDERDFGERKISMIDVLVTRLSLARTLFAPYTLDTRTWLL